MYYIIKGLALYFLPVNFLSKQKRVMRRGMKKPHNLNIRHCESLLIDLNGYLALVPAATFSDKIGVTELIKLC